MAISGNPRSFHKKFKFLIEIDGIARAHFKTCSELSTEVGVVKHREGGALRADKSPGLVEDEPITLERGVTNDLELYTWFKEVVDAASGTGLVDDQYKREMHIVQLDRDGSELRRWPVTGCWPKKFVAGAWDNDAEEVVIETVVLEHDGPEDPE